MFYETSNNFSNFVSASTGVTIDQEIVSKVSSYEDGGTIGEHIFENFAYVIDILIMFVQHISIVWETIWF